MYYFGKFRHWCQKVLPLVYDDSLSYYEVLCKLIKYIEQMLGDIVNLGQDVTNLQALYVELKKTVDEYLSDDKIEEAIIRAFVSVDGDVTEYAEQKAEKIADFIEEAAIETEEPYTVEEIQDMVEKGLTDEYVRIQCWQERR